LTDTSILWYTKGIGGYMKTKKKRKLKIRLPVPNKASRPMSTKKGKKGYKRKKKHKKMWRIDEIIERDGECDV